MIDIKRLINEFMELVQIDSESGNERKIADVLIGKFEELGCSVQEDNAGQMIGTETGNIVVTLDGDHAKTPLLFAAHMDTVVPGVEIEPIIIDEAIVSKGDTILGADDKAAIAVMLEVFKVLKEKNLSHGTIQFLITVGEEIGLLGAKNIDESLLTTRMGYALDSGGDVGTVTIQGPAQMKMEIEIKGKAAHAGGAPEDGVSAIMVASKAIAQMKHGRIDEETTANIGVIEGGMATNIVCPNVKLKAEARSLDPKKLHEQVNHMRESFDEVAQEMNAEIVFNAKESYPAFKLERESDVVRLVVQALSSLGIGAVVGSTGGGSDVNILNNKGYQMANLGIGMMKAHTLEESITIESLNDTVNLVLEIIGNS